MKKIGYVVLGATIAYAWMALLFTVVNYFIS